jgi:hypothetical protein
MGDLLPIRRAARKRRVRPARISAWVANGDIPGYRDGKRTILVDLDDVDARLRAHRVARNTSRAASEHARRVVGAVIAREVRK